MRTSPWQSYSKVATQTASPGQLVLMLYEGAIRFLDRAMTGFQLEDPLEFNQTINNNVLRAQAIIEELNARLNMEQGGDVSANFRRLYDYLHRRLNEGNVRKEKAPLEEVISRLRVLRDSWAEMLQKGQGDSGGAPVALQDLQAA
jgi:flagellar secretion chaperone FliS